ncbi:MAG TPA: hypothetical protein VNM14_16005 [Planctomycetota bacterium]|nr:hypothetical protein [Planctomycetota bacterium]
MRSLLGAFAFVLVLAASAVAQEKPLSTSKEMDQTVRITVTGEIEFDYVWRRQEITAFTGGVSGTSAPGDSASENTFEGFAALRMNIELSDKVSALLEIGTKRVDSGKINFFAGPNGAGGSTALTVQLREAGIRINELFMPELSLQAGISQWGFDVRNHGDALAFDLRHSQRFTRNVSASSDNATSLGRRASDPEELEPVGFWLRWERTSFALDLVALPAVIEGGSPNNDEALYALDLLYTADNKGSRIGLIVAAIDDPGGRSTVFTYGGGVDWKGVENFDVYGEFYFQNGWNNGPAAGITPVKVGGYAFQVGARFDIGGDLKPWVEANLTYYSGDGDAVPNGKSSAFLSYENVHDLMILEDMYLGFDWDSNYRAIKLSGGIALNAGAKNNLKLMTIVGLTQTARTVRFPSDFTHKLGNEVDVKVAWEMTKQVVIDAGVGFLFGSKVLELSLGGPGAPDAERQTILFTLGMNLRF